MARCPNCGKPGYDEEKKDYECRECGYHNPNLTELPPVQMTFCEACGCHYTNGCPQHDTSVQKKIKL